MTGSAARWEKNLDRAIDGLPHTHDTARLGTGHPRVRPATSGPPRFGQLSYASLDSADGRSGWQVKQVTGAITAEEQRALVGRIAHHFSSPWTAPHFLDAAALAQRPRRLVYAPVTGVGTAYWHSVPAGSDTSNRPGNVFFHVLLDRHPDVTTPALRSSDLLGARHWLAPYDPAAVREADLDEVPDPPWGGVSRDAAAVVSFLIDRLDAHPNVLQALLDGVATVMRPDMHGTVVLGVARPEAAIRWITALCHLMSPGTSRRFHWSTAERPDTLAAATEQGVHLAAVPLEDLGRVRPSPELLVIADGPGEVELGNLSTGQHHETRRGARLAVTPWSVLASAVLRDADHALLAMGLLDGAAADVDDTALPCAWPLAMAVLQRPADFADGVPAARELLGAVEPPAGLAGVPHLKRTIRLALTEGVGSTTEDAYRATEAAEGPARALAVNIYLERAVGDREWLTRAEHGGAVPVPELDLDLIEQDTADAAVDALAEVTELAAALRLVDLLEASGLLRSGLLGHGPHQVRVMLDRLAGRRMLHPVDGPGLADSAGPAPERIQAAHVRPWVDRLLDEDPRAPGLRLAPAVLRWLFPEPPPVPAPGSPIPATVGELAAQALLVVPDPGLFRAAAVRTAGRHGAAAAEISRIASAGRWSATEVCGALADVELASLAAVLPATLLGEEWSEALTLLVDQLIARPGDADGLGVAVGCARLQQAAMRWWRDPADVAAPAELLALADVALDAAPATRPAPDLRDALLAAWVTDLLSAPTGAPVLRAWVDEVLDPTGPAGRAVSRHVTHRLLQLARDGVLDDLAVVEAALVTSPGWSGAPSQPHRWEPLGPLTVGVGGRPLLEWIVHWRVHEGAVDAEVAAEVIRRIDASHDPAWRSRAHESFVAEWWQRVGLKDVGPSSGWRRRHTREGGRSR